MTVTNMLKGRQVVASLTNQSGGAVIAGDVVIVSAANDESFTTTTSAAYYSTEVGVALESIASAAAGRILLEGYAPLVNVSASATRGHYLFTHTVAKQATSSASYAAGSFGQIIKAGTTPSAILFPIVQAVVAPVYPKHASLWLDECVVAVGNALSRDVNDTYAYNNVAYSGSAAINDQFDLGFVIAAGTYTIKINYQKGPTCGIATITIDGGSSLGTIDTYAAGWASSVDTTLSSGALSAGYHKLSITMAAKHASSSGYRFGASKIMLIPAAY